MKYSKFLAFKKKINKYARKKKNLNCQQHTKKIFHLIFDYINT
jgi:hypothetical protein